jgi:hypothetical protein
MLANLNGWALDNEIFVSLMFFKKGGDDKQAGT